MFSSFSLPSISYPPPRDGYWNPVTSTINWCEEDYYATIYSAEIVNTLTNLLFIALGIRGIRACLRYNHDTIFLISFIGYLLVGTGSFAFHSTLKYPMQLVDELSMIYTTSIMFYSVFSFAQSLLFRQLLALGLVCMSIFITVYYHYLQDPAFHQNAFALLSIIVVGRSCQVMEFNIRPSLRAKYATAPQRMIQSVSLTKSQRAASDRRDEKILRDMWLMVVLGLAIFLTGFGIWSLDNHYCSTIRRWRHQIGLPWGILLEGHAYWHLMTGTGAYFYVTWAIWLRHCLNGEDYVLCWPSLFFSLPEVVPVTSMKAIPSKDKDWHVGDQNGHTVGPSKKSI